MSTNSHASTATGSGLRLAGDVRTLLDGANVAHLATLPPDRSPRCASVWVGIEGEHVEPVHACVRAF